MQVKYESDVDCISVNIVVIILYYSSPRCYHQRKPGKDTCGYAAVSLLSHFQLFCDLMGCSASSPLSMGFPRQASWNGLLISSPEGLHRLGIKPSSLVSPALAGIFFTTEPPGKPKRHVRSLHIVT